MFQGMTLVSGVSPIEGTMSRFSITVLQFVLNALLYRAVGDTVATLSLQSKFDSD